jgi:hypothetical protein
LVAAACTARLVVGDDVEDLVELLLGEVRGAHVGIKAGGGDDEIGPGRANTVDIPEGISDLLFGGEFNAEETRHNWMWLRVGC